MANSKQQAVLALLRQRNEALSAREILVVFGEAVPSRSLRRWLTQWCAQGVITRHGKGPSTRYQIAPSSEEPAISFGFLQSLDADLRQGLLAQIRDLWTHTTTALEGNTLSLGDTHFILEQGLTISGKPLREHQEITGHARAIELLYALLNEDLSEKSIFDLHRAVQTEDVTDIYKPIGAWKVENNGTYALSPEGKQVFIEYAQPLFVPGLMRDLMSFIDGVDLQQLNLENAYRVYAQIHMGFVHIHPFWDGNGRLARLLANIPLLRAGLPPLVVSAQDRRNYIRTLADYQITVGQLNGKTGVWPQLDRLNDFYDFCADSYQETLDLVKQAYEIQERR